MPGAIPTVPTSAGTQVGPQQPYTDFRAATLERTDRLSQIQQQLGASQVSLDNVIEGSGYIYNVVLKVGTAHAPGVQGLNDDDVTVVFKEDAPWSVLKNVVLRDPQAEEVNAPGYSLRQENIFFGNYRTQLTDPQIVTVVSGIESATGLDDGGSFFFFIRVPVAINRRTLLGLLGNTDRTIKYQLRTDIAPSTEVYTTPPTTGGGGSALDVIVITPFYESYTVPPAASNNRQNEQFPYRFGTTCYVMSTLTTSAPLGGSTVDHFLTQLGNTDRNMILEFRSNGTRAAAEAAQPTVIAFKVGDTDVFSEEYAYRRFRMNENYGASAMDNGILCYDFMHDFMASSGVEVGDDYMNLQYANNAKFAIGYPAAFGSTNNTLRMDTSYIIFAP
jgi:hypothetical protein